MTKTTREFLDEFYKRMGIPPTTVSGFGKPAPNMADAEPVAKPEIPQRDFTPAERKRLLKQVEEQIISNPTYQAALEKTQEAEKAKLERIEAANAAGEITPEIWDRARLYAVIKYKEAQLAGKTKGLTFEEIKMQAADNIIARLLELLDPKEGEPESGP